VTDADEFRKQAEDARQMAARSIKKEDKAFWLRLAEDWIKLAQSKSVDSSFLLSPLTLESAAGSWCGQSSRTQLPVPVSSLATTWEPAAK
jgi:hypothetical protein